MIKTRNALNQRYANVSIFLSEETILYRYIAHLGRTIKEKVCDQYAGRQ